MLELRATKEIKGALASPPSSDLFVLSLALAVATGAKTRISPVCATPYILSWVAAFKSIADVSIEGQTCSMEPLALEVCGVLRLPFENLPFCDFIAFLLLGRFECLCIDRLPPKRFNRWVKTAGKAGCILRRDETRGADALVIDKKDHFKIPDIAVDVEETHPFLGLAMGLRVRADFFVEQGFSSPLRQVLPSFGFECIVKNNAQSSSEDPLVRRLRFLKTGKKSEGPLQFSVSADFSKQPLSAVEINVPGDEVFGALMILAKCLIPKGSLVIENVGLEAWNTQTLQLLKTMGGTVGTQETAIGSFGSVGTVIVQKMSAFGRKIECRPWWQYAAQFPAMAVMASFAQGQTIFRGLDDLRGEEPDGVERIIACIAALGARYGEMPDGIVIEGAKQFDGFDLRGPLPAQIAGAFAVAALKCRGVSTIDDHDILLRWPDFKETLFNVCDFKD